MASIAAVGRASTEMMVEPSTRSVSPEEKEILDASSAIKETSPGSEGAATNARKLVEKMSSRDPRIRMLASMALDRIAPEDSHSMMLSS